MRHLLSVADIRDDELELIRQSARRRFTGADSLVQEDFLTVGLLFLEPSLRTRIGFAVASASLGWSHVEVTDLLWHPGMSESEGYWDTLRVLSSMVDILVTRPGMRIDSRQVIEMSTVPIINGGDSGGSHPTQAVIDLVAIEFFAGEIADLHIGICGDLGMRTAQSLIQILGRIPPARLTLTAPACRDIASDCIPPSLRPVVTQTNHLDASDLDVLYLPGLPERQGAARLDAQSRAEFSVTERVLENLPRGSIVLSPMPVIDEISQGARSDPRLRLFETTKVSVQVRADILRLVAGWRH